VTFFPSFLLLWTPVATSSSARFYVDSDLARRDVCSTWVGHQRRHLGSCSDAQVVWWGLPGAEWKRGPQAPPDSGSLFPQSMQAKPKAAQQQMRAALGWWLLLLHPGALKHRGIDLHLHCPYTNLSKCCCLCTGCYRRPAPLSQSLLGSLGHWPMPLSTGLRAPACLGPHVQGKGPPSPPGTGPPTCAEQRRQRARGAGPHQRVFPYKHQPVASVSIYLCFPQQCGCVVPTFEKVTLTGEVTFLLGCRRYLRCT